MSDALSGYYAAAPMVWTIRSFAVAMVGVP